MSKKLVIMQLSELQQHFKQYIFNPESPEAEQLKSMIAVPPADTITDRLSIYSDGYEARLGEVLEKTFPALKKYIGEDIFDEWCHEYIHLYPSTFFSVSRIGYQFSLFLKNKNYHLESEIAALEWAINTAVDAGNAVPDTQQNLTQIPQEKWGDIILECHPSLQVLLFNYNTLAVYKAIVETKEQEQEKDQDQDQDQDIKLAIKNISNICRVWRKKTQIYYLSMDNPMEKFFLESIQQKLVFSEICEKLAEQMPEDEVVNYAIKQILAWLQDELITGLRVAHELA